MITPLTRDSLRAADYWDAEASIEGGAGALWLELPAVQAQLNRKVSSDPEVNWVQHTLNRYFAGQLPLARCLSLGCGRGGLERELAELGAFQACTAFDVSGASIEEARTLARAAGYAHIEYAVEDGNKMVLPPASYDAIWSKDAAHHFGQLEHVFKEVRAALRRPAGLFILYEYVGPNRFQFPARQRQVIEACHRLLPVELRTLTPAAVSIDASRKSRESCSWLTRRVIDKLRDGDLLGAIDRRMRLMRAVRSGGRPVKTTANLPSARSVRALDPSEAVRSADIMPLLRRHFNIVEFVPLGGSLLQFLLADIAGNFQDALGETWLHVLFQIEDSLIASGDLASDFAYIVCAP